MTERDRKLEHIELSLDNRIQLERSFFDDYALPHRGLPEIALADVDLRTEFLGKQLAAPLLISCMTGGTGAATQINRNLAEAAEKAGVALGVGSQRKALEDPETAATFVVRDAAPNVPILGNLGAVQLNEGMGLAECRRAVEMVDADALVLHLNPLQEALQPEGQTNFKDLLPKIGALVYDLDVPVAVKEIGCGLAVADAEAVLREGVRILDTAGLGGTSWARIEAARSGDLSLGELFAHWGIPTPESIAGIDQLRSTHDFTLIGSGGVRSGLDVAKSVALGADLVGLAQPFLAPAMESADRVVETIERLIQELKIAMFCCGTSTLKELRRVEPIKLRQP